MGHEQICELGTFWFAGPISKFLKLGLNPWRDCRPGGCQEVRGLLAALGALPLDLEVNAPVLMPPFATLSTARASLELVRSDLRRRWMSGS